VAYEKKLVPSSGKGSSISVSGAFCQEQRRHKQRPDAVDVSAPWRSRDGLPRNDKVVALLDKIPNTSHLRELGPPPHSGPI
jgi:hypothetical protein